jgi:hypothetical protein
MLSGSFGAVVFDRFGNPCGLTDSNGIVLHLIDNASESIHEEAMMDSTPVHGEYVGIFEPKFVGAFTIEVIFNNNRLIGGPIPVSVTSSDASATYSYLAEHTDITCVAGSRQRFTLTSCDCFNNVRANGGDVFNASVEGSSVLFVKHIDQGLYEVIVEPTKAGENEVSVKHWGDHVSGSPFMMNVLPSAAHASHSRVNFLNAESKSACQGVAGEPLDLLIECRDKFGNLVDGEVSQLRLQCSGTTDVASELQCVALGKWQAMFVPTVSGSYTIRAFVDEVEIAHSPLSFSVQPAVTSVANCQLIGVPQNCIAGDTNSFTVRVCDEFDNDRLAGGDKIALESDDAGICSVRNNDDGTYLVTFVLERVGTHSLQLRINDTEAPSSPISIECSPTIASGAHSIVRDGGISKGLAGESSVFYIDSFDRFGNQIIMGGSAVSVEVDGQASLSATVHDLHNGQYECRFKPLRAATSKV